MSPKSTSSARIHAALVVGVLAALGATALAGCKSDGTPPVDAVDADFVSCADETRATPYQPGMQETSQGGGLVVKILKSTFTDAAGNVLTEPPAKGLNVWTIEADSAATGAPVDGLTISISPYMPDHKHGTTAAGVTPAGAGTYTIAPLNLYMSGYWEITVDLKDPAADGGAPDSAMFPICVPG
jgi:hypothetical protein